MTTILCSVAILLCLVSVNEACSCTSVHPQVHFCSAEFVIRAKVLSQEVEGEKRVFNLQILETFKGCSRFNETEGIHVNGSEQHSLFAKAYTERYGAMCGVWLRNGTVYLLGGYIWEGKPQLDLCGMNKEWSLVTAGQRLGIRGVYGQNCECRISPCFSEIGCGKLQGCAYSWMHGPNITFYVALLYLLIFL